MNEIMGAIQSIDWGNPSWDLFLMLFFLIGSLLYGLSLGRDRIIVIMVSIYMALGVVNFAPFIKEFNADVNINDAISFRVVAFLGLFLLLFFFLSQNALLRSFSADSYGAFWQVLIFSVIHVGLLMSVTLSFLPPEVTDNLSSTSKDFLISDVAKSVWITLPIVAMALFKGRD